MNDEKIMDANLSQELPLNVLEENEKTQIKSSLPGKNVEPLEVVLRRFKKQNAGIVAEVRKREHYEKPSVRRKKKAEAARKNKSKKFLNRW